MKQEVLHGLLAARTLFDAARVHCFVRDRHIASAGLVILQDAVELVFYSCLLAIGADEEKAVEQLSFDQLIGELRQRKIGPIKSGTLKAMNKQRVLIKHHAQLAEPSAVRHYYDTSVLATNDLLVKVIGKPLQHVVIADAIRAEALRNHIKAAVTEIETGRFLAAMIEIRKALFVAVESDYDVREWAQYDSGQHTFMPFGRHAAPWHTRNREWIEQNVKEPTDYVQLDDDRVRAEMLEIGIDPEEFFNVWRLTPDVYYCSDYGWAVAMGAEDEAAATEDNARYCLDVVVSVIRNQEAHRDIIRPRPHRAWQARIVREVAVLSRAAQDGSSTVVMLPQGAVCQVRSVVTGMEGKGEYVHVFQFDLQRRPVYWDGYVERDACVLEEC